MQQTNECQKNSMFLYRNEKDRDGEESREDPEKSKGEPASHLCITSMCQKGNTWSVE